MSLGCDLLTVIKVIPDTEKYIGLPVYITHQHGVMVIGNRLNLEAKAEPDNLTLKMLRG